MLLRNNQKQSKAWQEIACSNKTRLEKWSMSSFLMLQKLSMKNSFNLESHIIHGPSRGNVMAIGWLKIYYLSVGSWTCQVY